MKFIDNKEKYGTSRLLFNGDTFNIAYPACFNNAYNRERVIIGKYWRKRR